MTVKTFMINDTFQSLTHLQCYKWLIVSKRVQHLVQNKCKIMREIKLTQIPICSITIQFLRLLKRNTRENRRGKRGQAIDGKQLVFYREFNSACEYASDNTF